MYLYKHKIGLIEKKIGLLNNKTDVIIEETVISYAQYRLSEANKLTWGTNCLLFASLYQISSTYELFPMAYRRQSCS